MKSCDERHLHKHCRSIAATTGHAARLLYPVRFDGHARAIAAIGPKPNAVEIPVRCSGSIASATNRPQKTGAGDPIGERIVVTGRVLDALPAVPPPGRDLSFERAGRYPHRATTQPADHRISTAPAGRSPTRWEATARPHQPGEYLGKHYTLSSRPPPLSCSSRRSDAALTQMYFRATRCRVRPMFIAAPARARAGEHVRLGAHDPRAGARLPLRHRAARTRRDADRASEHLT